MVRIDKNRVQQLEKELKGLVVPNHQYKKWEIKESLTKEQLISLERLLEKEFKKTRKEEHSWSKEIKRALHTLYPGLHACCLLRSVREKIEEIQQKTLSSSSNHQLAKYLSQELNNKQKNKEEKIEEIVNFCLDYLNQDIKENWRKRKNKTQILLTLAQNEWKNAKREAFKEIINEKVIERMKF